MAFPRRKRVERIRGCWGPPGSRGKRDEKREKHKRAAYEVARGPSPERGGCEPRWREEGGKVAETSLNGPSHQPPSPLSPHTPLPLLMLSALGCVGRPEAEKGIRNVKQFGDKEEGLSQVVRGQLSALIPATTHPRPSS